MVMGLLAGCTGDEEASTGVAASAGSASSSVSTSSFTAYPSDSGYTETSDDTNYTWNTGVAINGQMGDYNSMKRTIVMTFDISSMSGASVQNAYINVYRITNGDAPNPGIFQPYTNLGALLVDWLEPTASLSGNMGDPNNANYNSATPVEMGILLDSDDDYMTNLKLFTLDVSEYVDTAVRNGDSYFTIRLRHERTGNNLHRADFILSTGGTSEYRPYLSGSYQK